MNYQIEDYNELNDLLKNLNLAGTEQFCFLPENINHIKDEGEFIYPDTTTELRKLLEKENTEIKYLMEKKPLLRTRKSADWFGPTILFGSTLILQNPHLIDITISIISSYLYDFFKGTAGGETVKFDLVIGQKNKKGYKKISYNGSIKGVEELKEIIKQIEQ